MSDKQINFEAIGRCVSLQEKISQLIENRTMLYMDLRGIAASGMIVYENAVNTKSVDLDCITKPVELLNKINKINQDIIETVSSYNTWADKAGYEHYVISGDYTKDAGELVGFTAEHFECSHNSKLIVGHVICDAALQSADVIHKIKQELEEAARVQEAERKAVGEKIRQLSIDALRNSLGFA
ncbi:Uncharacterised protein [Providencia rustigianii]|uniref:Uncharacterized protein n=1 Tax=Providencia rustigianii TaxID=158850 RepID=A0A379G4F5_9GAMM|nr:hypothetical protein [Providencia rustigianii]SUC35827.1 Uncharacterised protein [Providencia rustigianii]